MLGDPCACFMEAGVGLPDVQDYRRKLQEERQATEAAKARVQELEAQMHDQQAAAAQSADSALVEVCFLYAPHSH